MDYRLQLAVIFSSVFVFISWLYANVMALFVLTGYRWKSRRATCKRLLTMPQRTVFWWRILTISFLYVHYQVLRVTKPLYCDVALADYPQNISKDSQYDHVRFPSSWSWLLLIRDVLLQLKPKRMRATSHSRHLIVHVPVLIHIVTVAFQITQRQQ